MRSSMLTTGKGRAEIVRIVVRSDHTVRGLTQFRAYVRVNGARRERKRDCLATDMLAAFAKTQAAYRIRGFEV